MRGNASVSQSNCLSCKYDSTGSSQSDHVYGHVSRARSLKKKRWRTKLRIWSLFVPKSCLFHFFLLILLESYREIDTVQCKNPIIVTEKIRLIGFARCVSTLPNVSMLLLTR